MSFVANPSTKDMITHLQSGSKEGFGDVFESANDGHFEYADPDVKLESSPDQGKPSCIGFQYTERERERENI